MTLDDLAAAMQAANMQALSLSPTQHPPGSWQASACTRGGKGWQIEKGATLEEAVAKALGKQPAAKPVEDVFG